MNETNNKQKYLTKDLKKILFISIGLLIILIALAIINAQTNFLFKIANLITTIE